ncbi:MAG: tRNA lysidine(34) synthetase TilS [Oscillospiraceae bacterium]
MNIQMIDEKALETIKKYDMFRPNDNVLVALSGGADSVALFYFLYTHKEVLQIKLFAAHLNHGIRGEESDRDEAFVKDMCKKYGVQLFVERAYMREKTPPKGMGTEQWARDVRYTFLQKCADEIGGKIATAHTLSDNCETLLFHLARGTSARGAGGIAPVRQNITRPFITVTRKEIEEYCSQNSLGFVTDSTNLQDEYARNKIRHNAMPVLEEINANAEECIGRFLENQKEISDYFDDKACILLKNACLQNGKYDRKLLENAEEIILKEALAKIISQVCDVSTDKVLLCLSLFKKEKGAVQLAQNKILEINEKFLFWRENKKEVKICEIQFKIGETQRLGEFKVTSSVVDCKESMNFVNLSKKDLKFYAEYGKIENSVVLRTRKIGDTFAPFGRKCTKSLKKFFIEEKVSVDMRDKTPLLAMGNEIIWVADFGFADGFVANTNSEKVIKIDYKIYD